jgi:hypothetical protein
MEKKVEICIAGKYSVGFLCRQHLPTWIYFRVKDKVILLLDHLTSLVAM